MITFLLTAVLVGLTLVTLMGYGGRRAWLFDLASHFRWHAVWVSLLLIPLLVWQERPFFLAVAALLFVLNLFAMRGYIRPVKRILATSDQTHRVAMLNVRWAREEVDSIRAFVAETDPDLLILVEMTPKWDRALADLRQQYPHHNSLKVGERHGIILYSRLPILHPPIHLSHPGQRPSVMVKVAVNQRPLTIIGTHPPAPVSAERYRQRDAQMGWLTSLVNQQTEAILLTGDLNMTPWCPTFRQFRRQTGLLDARVGYGRLASWPTQLPLGRIPIDHLLVSPSVMVHHFQVGPNAGSDHLPVVADISL